MPVNTPSYQSNSLSTVSSKYETLGVSLSRPRTSKLALQHTHFGYASGIPIQQNALLKIIKHPEFAAHLEDIVGFGLVRTLFNTFRMYFFKSVDEKHKQINLSAAREWSIRELGNQFCANFLSGLSMVGIVGLVRKLGRPHIADQFASNDTLTLFQNLIKNSPEQEPFIQTLGQTIAGDKAPAKASIQAVVTKTLNWMQTQNNMKNEAEFIQHLASQLDPHGAKALLPKIQAFYEQVRQNPTVEYTIQSTGEKAKQVSKKIKNAEDFVEALRHTLQMSEHPAFDAVFKPTEHAAIEIAKLLNQKDFGIQHTVEGQTLHLNVKSLLEDAHQFLQAVPKNNNWKQAGLELLTQTNSIKRWAIPLALGIGMTGTVLIPYLNKWITEKVDRVDDYVGEMGLRDLKKVDPKHKKGWLEQAFPYVASQWKKGDIWPALISLIPIPFGIGMFDNGALHSGQWSKALNLPKSGFFKRAFEMFQFRKGAPYMTAHQLLALCALVCTARVLTARDKIEMRERLVDSYGGWAVWAVGYGILKKGLAQWFDSKGSQLLNGNTMRAAEEIQHFMSKEAAEKTVKAAGKLKWSATLLLVAIVGILEPYLALKWTEYQVRKDQHQKPEETKPKMPERDPILPAAAPLMQASAFRSVAPAAARSFVLPALEPTFVPVSTPVLG